MTTLTLSIYSLVQVINKPTHRCSHIIDWVIVRPDDDIHKKSTVTDSLESDHYCTKSYFNGSVSKPSTLYRTVRNIANINRPSFIAELSSVSEFSSVEKANQFCDFLFTVLDKHAPPSLRKVITHNTSPWFDSIRDELFMAKRERRQAERKLRNTKLTIFKDLYRQAKHKVSKLVHTANCKFYTVRIALASSSKELHQIVNALSNRHAPKILPTIYPSADLPSIFIKHFTNKVEKLRANIASERVTSALVTGTTAATFSSFEKVSQLTVKECILNSAPKSCEHDFSLPHINWKMKSIKVGSNQHIQHQQLLDMEQELGFEQLMQLSPSSESNMLDLYFTTFPSLVKSCYTVPGISDHHVVVVD